MGTFCLLSVSSRGDDELSARRALAAGKAEVTACELALSRFDPASDLTRANAAAGSWVAVDERLVGALAQARRMRDETGGLFDPTVLPALIAAGYDRTFEQLSDRTRCAPWAGTAAARSSSTTLPAWSGSPPERRSTSVGSARALRQNGRSARCALHGRRFPER